MMRDEAMKWMTKYKGAMARYYNKKVNVRRFNIGNLVLRKVWQATKDSSQRRIILPKDPRWLRTTSSTEHRTLKEILSVRIPKYSKMLTFI